MGARCGERGKYDQWLYDPLLIMGQAVFQTLSKLRFADARREVLGKGIVITVSAAYHLRDTVRRTEQLSSHRAKAIPTSQLAS